MAGEPTKEELQAALTELTGLIFKESVVPNLPNGTCAALLLFGGDDVGTKQFTAYASNARRREMVAALRECADVLARHCQ